MERLLYLWESDNNINLLDNYHVPSPGLNFSNPFESLIVPSFIPPTYIRFYSVSRLYFDFYSSSCLYSGSSFNLLLVLEFDPSS